MAGLARDRRDAAHERAANAEDMKVHGAGEQGAPSEEARDCT
jgi:hypothetical protein